MENAKLTTADRKCAKAAEEIAQQIGQPRRCGGT